MSSHIFLFDDFEFDSDRMELSRVGVPVRANSLILRLLEVFVQRPGELITREEFGERIWQGREVSESTLTVGITRLRRTLGHERGAHEYVQTIYRRGYRFLRPVETRVAPPPPLAANDHCAQARSPFVGRERILEHLEAAMSQARLGDGGLFVLTGEPGSGKTRTAEMLASRAEVPVGWGYHRELEQTPPLAAISGSLRDLIQRSPLVRSALRDSRFLALIPELTQLVPELGGNANVPAARTGGFVFELASKQRLSDAVTRALSMISEYTPLVLILDDLHRADAASLALLNYLLPELGRTRILVLATLSNEQRALASPALRQLLGHGNCTRVPLRPLSETEVASYVVAQLGAGAKPLCRSVSEKCGGNPLFMSMLVRQLRHSDLTRHTEPETPSALLSLVLHRFGVDDATREILSVAAVIGRRFSLSLLQATTGCDARTLTLALDAAVADELIAPVGDAQVEFAFTHELLRAALYETIGASERRSWHLRVGNVLDQRAACAHRSAIAIADQVRAALPDGDLQRTVLRCIEAANACAQKSSFADSSRYLQCAQAAIALMEASSQRDCASAREALAANGGDERFAIPATELDQHAHTPAAE
jgi:predicted ATPase